MGVWQAIELLNTLVDDSDPDVCFRSCFTTRFCLTRYMFVDKCVSNRTSFTDRGGHTAGWQARVDAGEFIDITASAQFLSRTPILASVPLHLSFSFLVLLSFHPNRFHTVLQTHGSTRIALSCAALMPDPPRRTRTPVRVRHSMSFLG